MISRERIDRLVMVSGKSLPTIKEHLVLAMADKSEQEGTFEIVRLCVRLRLRGVPLLMRLDVVVMDELCEDFILGKPSIDEFGLLDYMSNPERWLLTTIPPANEEIETDVVEIMPLTIEEYSVEDVNIGSDFPCKRR